MNAQFTSRRLRMPWQKKNTTPKDMDDDMFVTMLNHLPKQVKGHIVAAAGELVGTFLFLLFGMGGLNAVNDAPMQGENSGKSLAADSSKLLFISLAFGFSLAVNAWVFFRISGGLFNPAVALGMVLIGKISALRGAIIFVAQLLGAIAASAVVSGLTPGPLKVQTQLEDGTSIVQGLFIEMFLTAELVFTIFMLAAEKHAANFIAPVGIGLALFIAQMFGTYYTGCSVNPARSFGPDVVVHQFPGYHWIYWVGPGLGAILAAAFYKLIKALEYETVNMEKDPLEIVGRRYDIESKKDKLITRDGHEIDAPTDSQSRSPDEDSNRSGSDTRTIVGDSSAESGRMDLEAQKAIEPSP